MTALEKLLSRADRCPGRRALLDDLLFTAFGCGETSGDLPVASVTAAVDMDIDDQAWWLRADPVHLRADRDTLVLGGDALALTESEAARLVVELEPVFTPMGWRLHVGHPERWYLRLSHDPGVRTYAPAALIGRDIRPFLPHGAQSGAWCRLMNEAQMQLHTSPVNGERTSRSAPAVNSLWFWGGGTLPRVLTRWDYLWCDGTAGRGLARIAAAAWHPLPAGATDWLAQAAPGRHLIVIENPDQAARSPEPEHWRRAVQGFNDEWIAPLAAALLRRRLARLALITDTGVDYVATPAGLRRWWRRRGSLERLPSAAQ